MGKSCGNVDCSRSATIIVQQETMVVLQCLVSVSILLVLPTSARYCVDCQTFLGCLLTCRNTPNPRAETPRRTSSTYPNWKSFDSLVSRVRQDRLSRNWPSKV